MDEDEPQQPAKDPGPIETEPVTRAPTQPVRDPGHIPLERVGKGGWPRGSEGDDD